MLWNIKINLSTGPIRFCSLDEFIRLIPKHVVPEKQWVVSYARPRIHDFGLDHYSVYLKQPLMFRPRELYLRTFVQRELQDLPKYVPPVLNRDDLEDASLKILMETPREPSLLVPIGKRRLLMTDPEAFCLFRADGPFRAALVPVLPEAYRIIEVPRGVKLINVSRWNNEMA